MDTLFRAEEMTSDEVLRRLPVLLPVALDQTYDYRLPQEAGDGPALADVATCGGITAASSAGGAFAPGAFVLVPFGAQQRIGIVWDKPYPEHKETGAAGKGLDASGPDAGRRDGKRHDGKRHDGRCAKALPDKKLKSIIKPIDVPPLPVLSLRFAEWIATYTLSPLGMVARMMMSAPNAFEPAKPRLGVAIAQDAVLPPRMTAERIRVMELAGDGLIRARSELARQAQCSSGVVNGLVAAGCLVEVEIPPGRFPIPDPEHAKVEFGEHQLEAVHGLRAAVDGDNFSVTLLDGVTGSGKTEVYFEAVAASLARGRQVVIMLPEIALTSQFINRFKARFGCAPAEWHSALSGGQRARVWKAAATGEAACIVGARSALFLPFKDLGLIVVDEEHDQGYKQDDRVNYQGRDMAVVRGSLGGFPVVLASATPSIESHVNAQNGRYRHLILKGRYSGTELPDVRAIDLRKGRDPPERGRWLSPILVTAIEETLADDQQSLLFLNRRGYAPMTLCRACGHRFECPQCTAWLVEHRFRKRLTCHHCGFSLPLPNRCPKCEAEDTLIPCGPGVERIAEEVSERFPDARMALLSSDLVPGLKEMRKVIDSIERREADIIIGTQMVAKGHHFPGLQTVGIVDGDLGLTGADPRAAERSFQLMHQVTGRAGRTHARGRGFVQTHLPEHPVMQAIVKGDRDAFVTCEIKARQAAMMPPYGRLAALVISARDRVQAEGFAREVVRRAPPAKCIEVLGPAEAPIAIVRGRHRLRILVKAPRNQDIQSYIRAWMSAAPAPRGDLRLSIDVDPYNFL